MRLNAASRRGALTPALPMPYPAFEHAGLRLRRGQLSLWVAAPGVGKTQLLHNLAHRMQFYDPVQDLVRGVPALYWSADTDQHDVAMRALALWSGQTVETVVEHYGQPEWADYFAEKLSHASHIDWIFDPTVRGQMVAERTSAFAEAHGEYPHLMVVDNLSNTVEDPQQSLAEQTEFMSEAQKLARNTKAHVAVLAHAKGIYDTGDKPIPQSGVLNNLFKLPEIGVTLYRANEDATRLGANVVKNRGGKADPGANHPIMFDVDFATASVLGFRPTT